MKFRELKEFFNKPLGQQIAERDMSPNTHHSEGRNHGVV